MGVILKEYKKKTLKKNPALINAGPKKVLHYQKPVDLFNFFLSKCTLSLINYLCLF